jgi:N-methylhydantoinase A
LRNFFLRRVMFVTLVGIDTGGTFTDFVVLDEAGLRLHKVLSTPAAPEQAILQGLAELGVDPAGLQVVHGSTVATNAALEGKGARTAYIGNRGLRDLLTIGRQARRELYDLQPPPLPPPVARELCLETGGRLGADGGLVEPLTAADLAALTRELRALAPQAVAINLLFSYLDDRQEREVAAAVPEGIFVARSSEVLPLIGEYERGLATWLNAWLGPRVEGYIRRLAQGLPGARVAVMQSSGEAIAADQAARQAVRMLLSGPAGGLVGARYTAGLAGREQLLSFDMGGTSTDVALIDGEPRLTSAGRIGPWPVAVPMVDLHSIGAGGGSLARLDPGGMLLVGPESAGADPGPACYGRGGQAPTVTDANLVLGRLAPEAFLGGRLRLDTVAARGALAGLARRLDLSPEQAALGVVRVANAHMAAALRLISVERGIDPRPFTLASFGGAGGMHVCDLATALGMTQALVPVQAGVLSALGMLASRPGRRLSRTWLGRLEQLDAALVDARLAELGAEGCRALAAEGVPQEAMALDYGLDLRYHGQSDGRAHV